MVKKVILFQIIAAILVLWCFNNVGAAGQAGGLASGGRV
jgi:hypothetical protein